MSQTYLPDEPIDYVADHSGHTPHHDHHHHHKHEHHKHERHHHQGDSPYTVNQDSHDTINSRTAAPIDPLQACLQALRGIGSVEKCEAVLGHVIAALAHSDHIRGLLRPVELAMTHMNHYTSELPTRNY